MYYKSLSVEAIYDCSAIACSEFNSPLGFYTSGKKSMHENRQEIYTPGGEKP